MKIFNGMTRKEDLQISPIEVTAILEPVETFIAHHRESRIFARSLYYHVNKTEPEYLENMVAHSYGLNTNTTEKLALPKIFEEKNYFGKILGPNLLQVMELMLHSTLHTIPMDPTRFLNRTDIYGNFEEYMEFNIELDPFHPTWKDWKGLSGNRYYEPFSSIKAIFAARSNARGV